MAQQGPPPGQYSEGANPPGFVIPPQAPPRPPGQPDPPLMASLPRPVAQPHTPTFTEKNPGLYQRVVAILASTANGCIAELGYPQLCQRLQAVEGAYKELVESEKRLREENAKMAALLKNHPDRNRSSAGNTVKDQAELHQIQVLQARIKELEKDKDILTRQNHMLRQSQSLNAPEAYKVLEAKYNYVLELLKKDHSPVIFQSQAGNSSGTLAVVRHVTDVGLSGNVPRQINTMQAPTPSNPEGFVKPQRERMSLPSESPVLSNSHLRAPPIPQAQAHPTQPKRLSVTTTTLNPPEARFGPLPLPTPPLSAPPFDPKTNLRRDASSLSASAPSLSGPSAKRPRPVANGGSSSTQILHLAPRTNVEGQQSMRELAQSVTYALRGSQQTKTGNHPLRRSSMPAPDPSHQVLPPEGIQYPGQLALVSADVRLTPVRSLYAESSLVAPVPKQSQSEQPKPRVELNQKAGSQASPVPAPDIVIINSSETRESHSRDREPEVLKSPLPNGTPQEGDMLIKDPQEVHTSASASDSRDTADHGREGGSQDQPTNNVQSNSIAVDGPSKPPSLYPPVKEIITPVAESSTADADSEMAELPVAGSSVSEDIAMDDGEGGGDTEDEQDEDWSDLTDDESNALTGGKRPVEECISTIFIDENEDERFCQLCILRIQALGLADQTPSNFIDSGWRELIVHAKNEHPVAWQKLRQREDETEIAGSS